MFIHVLISYVPLYVISNSIMSFSLKIHHSIYITEKLFLVKKVFFNIHISRMNHRCRKGN